MFSGLSLPLMCAPMSFASSVPLAVACCQSGVIGGWQGGTYTSFDAFEQYVTSLEGVAGAPPIVNLPSRIANEETGEAKLALLEQHRAPLVLSSLGDPSRLVERVHGWGGRVIQDVVTMRHAQKAVNAGVDGLMLTCAGAGGHTGFLTPFAFAPAVRRIWEGLLIVAGGIADARGIAAVLTLGGDIACMGTRFIATPESGVVQSHRDMIASAEIDRIVLSSAMNGVPANWIRDSLETVGLNSVDIAGGKIPMPDGIRAWRDVFSAGQSVALIDAEEPVHDVVARLKSELAELVPEPVWRGRLQTITKGWAQ